MSLEAWFPTRVMHVRIDVHVWRGDPFQKRMDLCLEGEGSKPLDLEWDAFPLEEDGDHFTREGMKEFARSFARAVRPVRGERVIVLSDSTIGHHGEEGTSFVARALRREGAREAIVDAVSGSGFVAMAGSGNHFYPRLSHIARNLSSSFRSGTAVVFVGGWNDARQGEIGEDMVCECAKRCVNMGKRVGVTLPTPLLPLPFRALSAS